MAAEQIHFHSADDRFCGSRLPGRRFTLEDNDVTCPACKDRDGFVLSDEAFAYVTTLDDRAA